MGVKKRDAGSSGGGGGGGGGGGSGPRKVAERVLSPAIAIRMIEEGVCRGLSNHGATGGGGGGGGGGSANAFERLLDLAWAQACDVSEILEHQGRLGW